MGGDTAGKTLDDSYNKDISFNYADAFKKIKSAKDNNFELLVLTNSNFINVAEYYLLKYFCNCIGITLLPGVELCLKSSENSKDQYLHVVLIFNQDVKLLELSKILEKHIGKVQENSIDFSTLVELVWRKKCIVVPHGLKHDNRSAVCNPTSISEIAGMANSIPILIEDNKKYNRETLKLRMKDLLNENDYQWLASAGDISCLDRTEDFSGIESPTYIWGGANFNDLYLASLMHETRIKRENDIIPKTKYISKIKIVPRNDKAEVLASKEINCSHGLNSIIGDSGSGKTLLLNWIFKKLSGHNLKNKISSVDNNYDNIYENSEIMLYDENGKLINETLFPFEGENLYNKILNIYESDKNVLIDELGLYVNDNLFKELMGNFSEYLNDLLDIKVDIIETEEKLKNSFDTLRSDITIINNNKSIKKIINLFNTYNLENVLTANQKKLEEVKLDETNTKYELDSLNQKLEKYNLNALKRYINLIKNKLLNNINLEKLKIQFEDIKIKRKLSVYLKVNYIISEYNEKQGAKIKYLADKQKEIEETSGEIVEIVKSLFLLKKKLTIPTLNPKILRKTLKLEDYYNIASLKVNNVMLNISNENVENILSANIGKAMGKINKKEFIKAVSNKGLKFINLSKKEDIEKFVDIFAELRSNAKYNDNLYLSLDYKNYLDITLVLQDEYGVDCQLDDISAGSLSKIYINSMLEKNILKNKGNKNPILFFDQPDNSLGKPFILDSLSDKLNELKTKYQIFITTHEPLLVINCDSNNIIYAQNNKKVGKKNNITYENVSINDQNIRNKKDLIERVAELVDGSIDAVCKRNLFYGGMKNENND